MDNKFFKRAIVLALKGQGFTGANPCVGAVIVKNNRIIGEGYHRVFGGAHAEVEAINNALESGDDLEGSKMYVTLEPCCHYGKTPPCADLILSSGISKVFVGMRDPFVKVNGGGIELLRRGGVAVEFAVSPTPFEIINQPFLKMVKCGLPYVVLKAGISLDGKIAVKTGESKWITGESSRLDARLERSRCDAVLVGSGTVVQDDCELATHGRWKDKTIMRVIIDKRLESPLDALVFRDENVFVATTGLASFSSIDRLRSAGVRVEVFGDVEVDILKLLKRLGKMGISSIFVEGGAGIHGSFLSAARKNSLLVDRMIFYIAPKIIGDGVSVVRGFEAHTLDDVLRFKFDGAKRLGDDFKFSVLRNSY